MTVIIDNGDGNYNIAYKRFICSTGNDTPYGTYYTPAKYRWKELMGPSYGQYSTRIVGGILFHSVPYKKRNPYTLSANAFNQLGTTCSHGCIRLMCIDAKWIYDNCGLGTRVVSQLLLRFLQIKLGIQLIQIYRKYLIETPQEIISRGVIIIKNK